MADEQGEGEHDQRDMAMPAVPASGFVVGKFGFAGLKGVLDRPAPSLDQGFQGRALPCRKERHLTVAQPDQQAARPHRRRGATIEEGSGIEIGQLQIGPVR